MIWGALHGFYLVFARLTAGRRERLAHTIGLDRVPALWAACNVVVTFNLVAVAWVFFLAKTLSDASWIVAHFFNRPMFAQPGVGENGAAPFSTDDLLLGGVLVVILEIVQWLMAGKRWRVLFDAQPVWVRWPAYYAMIVTILRIGELARGALSISSFETYRLLSAS